MRWVDPDAEAVDVPERTCCATCDPMPFLPDTIRATGEDAELMFPSWKPHCRRFPQFSAGQRSEYVRLVVKLLRCWKLGLAHRIHGGGSVLAVGKASGAQT